VPESARSRIRRVTSQPPPPSFGDVRIVNETRVEYWNGTAWVEHLELPDDQQPPDIRDYDAGNHE